MFLLYQIKSYKTCRPTKSHFISATSPLKKKLFQISETVQVKYEFLETIQRKSSLIPDHNTFQVIYH